MSDRKSRRGRWQRPKQAPPIPGRDATRTGTYEGNAFGTCLQKQWYPTEQIAMEAAARVYRERQVELRAYPCADCGNWHLTKTKKFGAAS